MDPGKAGIANQKAFLMAGDAQIHVSHHGERGTRREKGV